MKPDPEGELGARLFQSAREEPLPKGAANRAFLAARAEIGADTSRFGLSWQRASVVTFGVIALAAGIVLYARRDVPTSRISAEPSISRQRAHAHNEQPIRSAAVPTAVSARVAPLPPPSAQAPRPVASAPASLTDELSTLNIASTALSSGDARGALAALDRYDHVLKGTQMRAEATLLRIEALARGGQTEASSNLASKFIAQNPGNPLVDRARSFVK